METAILEQTGSMEGALQYTPQMYEAAASSWKTICSPIHVICKLRFGCNKIKTFSYEGIEVYFLDMKMHLKEESIGETETLNPALE